MPCALLDLKVGKTYTCSRDVAIGDAKVRVEHLLLAAINVVLTDRVVEVTFRSPVVCRVCSVRGELWRHLVLMINNESIVKATALSTPH